MYVSRIMRTNLVTVPPETTLADAKDIIEEKKIQHLLVVDKGNELLGVVSDRDIKQSWASPAITFSKHELSYLLNKVTIDMIMKKDITTITTDTTIERAARIMVDSGIGSLPVMEEGRLIGIITRTDVMEVLLEAIGIGDEDSSRFSVIVMDRIGYLADIAKLLKEEHINIKSLVSWPEKKHPGVYQLIMRVNKKDFERTISLLRDNGFKVLTENIKDITPYITE